MPAHLPTSVRNDLGATYAFARGHIKPRGFHSFKKYKQQRREAKLGVGLVGYFANETTPTLPRLLGNERERSIKIGVVLGEKNADDETSSPTNRGLPAQWFGLSRRAAVFPPGAARCNPQATPQKPRFGFRTTPEETRRFNQLNERGVRFV